jgi:nitroreductase
MTITTTPFDMMKEVMISRSSVKRFDISHVMTEKEIEELLTVAASAPSSWNAQQWRFLTITSPEQKQKMLPIAFRQQQVVEASLVIALLGDLKAYRTVDKMNSEQVEAGKMSPELRDRFVSQVKSVYNDKAYAIRDVHLNCGLVAMQLMLAAKAMGYDSCPMTGFDSTKLVEAFHVPERYIPVMLITIGKATQPARPTERLPLTELAIRESF